MNKLKIFAVLGLFMASLAFAGSASAYYPTMNLTTSGSSTTIFISGAQPYTSVVVNYTPSGSNLSSSVNGTTDGGGSFTTMISSVNSSSIVATVGGLQVYSAGSGYVGGCTYNCGTPYGLSLSQSNVYVSVGQSTTVTAYNQYGNLYVSSNSNPTAATANVSGNSVVIYGQNSGSTTLQICANSNGACGTVYVTVSGGTCYSGYCGGSGSLVLNQTSLSLTVGQNSYVTASNGNGSLYISNNTNSSVVSTTVSGNQINFYGLSAGSSTVTICGNSIYGGGNNCASVYVTVSGVLGANTNLWFSPANPNLYLGQSLAVSINSSVTNSYSGVSPYLNNYYYISSNSNSGVVSANISGSVLNLYANQTGSSNLSICHISLGFCSTLYVTVGGGSGSGNLSLSQTNVSLSFGQSTTVTASNSFSSSVYVSQNTNPSVVSTTVSGNIVYINAQGSGSSNISICATGSGGACGNVYVTVTGGGSNGLSFSPSNPTLYGGQSLAVAIYNSLASYGLFVSSNSNSNVVSASISGSTLTLYANNPGTSNIVVCSNGSVQCGTLFVTVSGSGSTGSSIFFTPSSLSLTIGQSNNVTISGPYSYNYYISTNSSPNVASAVIQNNILTVTGTNSGYTTFSICQNGVSQCGSLGVTVNSGGYGGYGSLSLSQTSAGITVGQTTYITAYNYGGSIYISNNSNPGVVSPTVSGNQINLRGLAAGSATVTVCGNSNAQCAPIYVTVTGTNVSYPGGGVLGSSAYNNGQLISEYGTVYIVYRNTKTGFISASVFRALGFNFSNVLEVGNSGVSDSGYTVRTANASHPWGSWIKSGKTIYFVHESGLIPVPDWNTFLSNGGQSNMVVPANHYDFTLPILSPMSYSDYRLQ